VRKETGAYCGKNGGETGRRKKKVSPLNPVKKKNLKESIGGGKNLGLPKTLVGVSETWSWIVHPFPSTSACLEEKQQENQSRGGLRKNESLDVGRGVGKLTILQ